jgi:hypothetical protein
MQNTLLWSLLTDSQRDKFLKAPVNPSSELAQQLLADETLERDRQEPWWEAPTLEDIVQFNPPTRKRFANSIQDSPSTHCLIYNISAVW